MADTIDPLFFSQECSDARICLRTGPVCMCGIEKMQAEHKSLLAALRAADELAEALKASLDGNHDWLETYCDVGAPDDCDHCVIVNALSAYRKARDGR